MFSLRAIYVLLALVVGCFSAIGQSWQSLNGPTRPHEVLNLAIGKSGNAQKIYAVDVDTVKISTDGGRSWIATGASSITAPLVVACQLETPSIAVVGRTGKETGIYRTSDAGTTWGDVGPSPDYDLQPQRVVFSPDNDQLAFLGTEHTPSED